MGSERRRLRPAVVIVAIGILAVAFAARAYLRSVAASEVGAVPYRPSHPTIGDDLDASIAAIAESRFAPAEQVYNTFYASIYDALFTEERYGFVLQRIVLHLAPMATERRLHVLDAGCGTGSTLVLLSRGYDTTGIDASSAMIRVASLRSPTSHLVVGDMRNADAFEPETFDAITSLYSAVFYTPDFRVVLRNFHRWLAPGGLLFIDVMDTARFDDPAFWASTDKDVRFREHVLQYRGAATFDGSRVAYTERFVIDGRHVREQVHHMVYPSQAEFVSSAEAVGFVVRAVHELGRVGDVGERLYVLRRVPGELTDR